MLRLLGALVFCAALVGCDCSPAVETESEPEPDPVPSPGEVVEPLGALDVDPDSIDFDSNPGLLVRLRARPHNYFRFVNVPFASEVCERFEADEDRAPRVNLHGDAHLEQYAVTDLGRGLTDFDGATDGPAVLDLVRMGTSMRLACAAHGWEEHEASFMDAFLAGYRAGVREASDERPPEPEMISRIRATFTPDRARLLRESGELADELAEEESDAARRTLRPYIDAQLAENSELDRRFFELVSIGHLDMGIGSALDEKYLLRVRGPTDSPDDDELLEAKEVLSISEIPCVGGAEGADPFRILVGESRIAYTPFPYLGYVQAGSRVFWIHGWTTNYREVILTESFASPDDLRELAGDIGIQLGRGHVNQIAAPLDVQLRRAALIYAEEHDSEIRAAAVELSDAVVAAWERFVRATDDHPALDGRAPTRASAFDSDR